MGEKRDELSGNNRSLPHFRKFRRNFPSIKLLNLIEGNPSIFMQWANKFNFSEDFLANTSTLCAKIIFSRLKLDPDF